MKPAVFEQILRPALADLKGKALFIGTPMGRNHFYDLYQYGLEDKDEDYKSWHFTSFDNPLLDPKEIETAKKSMSSFAFRTEFLASFEAASGGIFKEEWIKVDDEEPDSGRYFVAVDLAGFENVAIATTAKKKRLDRSAIAVVKVTNNNLDSDGTLAKIFYTNYPVKYKVLDREIWVFLPCRNFKRYVSKTYADNWNRYIKMENKMKVSNLYTINFMKDLQQRADNEKIKDYNEFDID